MTSTITHGTTHVTPTLVLGYEVEQAAPTILHRIIGRAAPDVTFRPASLRTGTLLALVETEAAAVTLLAMHQLPGTFTFTDTDLTAAGMTYVPTDNLTRTLDEDTRTMWIVSIPFEEVTA